MRTSEKKSKTDCYTVVGAGSDRPPTCCQVENWFLASSYLRLVPLFNFETTVSEDGAKLDPMNDPKI